MWRAGAREIRICWGGKLLVGEKRVRGHWFKFTVNGRGAVFHRQHVASLDRLRRGDEDATGSFENRSLGIAFANVLADQFYIVGGRRVDFGAPRRVSARSASARSR